MNKTDKKRLKKIIKRFMRGSLFTTEARADGTLPAWFTQLMQYEAEIEQAKRQQDAILAEICAHRAEYPEKYASKT